MTKYRIRLKGGRVIGPFVKDQLHELKAKGHINGSEEAQIFPIGNWGPISSFDFYPELMSEDKTKVTTSERKEETFVLDLTRLRQQAVEKEIDDLEEKAVPVPIEELTETIKINPPVSAAPPTSESVPQKTINTSMIESAVESVELEIEEEAEEDVGNKTIINPVAQQELLVLKRKLLAEEDREKAEEAKKIKDEKDRKEAEELALQLIEEAKDESTHMIKLDNIRSELMTVAEEEEVIYEKVAKDIKKKKEAEEKAENEDDDEEDDSGDEAKKKRKKLVIIVAAIALAYAILNPGDDKPKKPPFQNIPPQVIFPLPYDKADAQRSKIEFDKGKELFAQGGYVNIVKSGQLLKSSYENSLQNLPALNLLVRAYAEQLRYSKMKLADAHILFNIIQSKRPMLMQDPNGVIGLNLFYMAINKPEAAVDVTSKYLKLQPKNVTEDLFAIYLKSLIKIGKLDVAKQFYTALVKAPNKNRYTLDALIEYLMLNQEIEKAEEYVNDGLKRFPALVPFYLKKAEILIQAKKFKEVGPYLLKAEELSLEYNDVNRAKFLELTGLLTAANGDVKKATAYLMASLKLDDSDALRVRLADLNTTNGTLTDTDKLISESKAVKLLIQARDFYEKKNYELAMSAAAKATDASPGHVPSELFLAKVQLRLGLAREGLKTIEVLLKKYPDNKDINFAMIEAYINTYKFNDAKNRIAIVAAMEIKNSWEFASLNAKLYMKMGDSLQTISWLKASMNMNPLNDQDIYYLAETLIRRNNFDASRVLLNKCMELDPINADYRLAYAKLIYEKEDDQAAIGYMLSLLDEFGENPKFLGEIAIFYFRAGKVKEFMTYKEKLTQLPNKDKALYEFLIKSALLDERYHEIPGLVEQLIAIEPGDLESMMTAGRVLFEEGKLKDAAMWFKRVQDKLNTYPKVQYYIAKIKMLADEIEDQKDKDGKPILDINGEPILGALSLVQKDIKENGENDTSLVLLAQIYQKKDELVDAENMYKKAQKINPQSYDALVGMADLSKLRNNFDLALDLYKRAMNVKSDEGVLHKKVGDVYRLLGQGALAIESYKMYLEMNPDATDKKQIEDYISMMQ